MVRKRLPVSFVWVGVIAAGLIVVSVMGCEHRVVEAGKDTGTDVSAQHPAASVASAGEVSVDRGRYLVKVTGCNDCHTPGFMEKGFTVPESEWLTGVPVGWRGPWGTTYGSNLRRFAKDFDEETFVQTLRARNSRPPMPWPSLHAMSDTDLRSLFRYIRSLPVTGEPAPEYVPPGQEPKTPYVDMTPKPPKMAAR